MILNIHQFAAENFNRKASVIVGNVKELPPEFSRQSGFPSERHVSASLSEKDLIGEIDVATSDFRGKIVARFFYIDSKRFGLDEEDYKEVTEISEAVQSLPAVRSKISCSFVEKALFTWIKRKFQDDQFSKSFIDYLDNEAKSKITSITSWVPIANLEVEISFSIGKSEICPLSKVLIDKWESRTILMAGNSKENASEFFVKIRKDYQGLAAVVTVIEAEPERAFEYAMEEAQRATSILGIFSGAIWIPDVKCVSRIKGSENIAQATAIFECDSDGFQMTSSILDTPSARTWRLGEGEIFEIKKTALDKISLLLAAESLGKFKNSVLNSVLLYSKSAFAADPVEKVVYMLSALESILLKDGGEPIQQNLAERVAVFSANELQKRKSIIRTVKLIYGIRSRYLHHGHTSSELELVSEFMMCVWIFFVQLIEVVERYCSKEVFIAAIDDHKLA